MYIFMFHERQVKVVYLSDLNVQVTVGHKKASSTLIDDCVEKFRQHETERKRLRLLNGQRGSTETIPVDLLITGDGDPLFTSLSRTTEEPEAPGVEDLITGEGEKKQTMKSSVLTAFGLQITCLRENSNCSEVGFYRVVVRWQ